MIIPRWTMALTILGGVWGVFGVGQTPVRADGGTGIAIERLRFVTLLGLREQTGVPETIPIGPRSAAAFNQRLDRWIANNGLRPPPIPPAFLVRPITPPIAGQTIYRQNFIFELYRQRASRRLDGVAGGVAFWTPINPPLPEPPENRPPATPVSVVSPVNIFDFFPVYRLNAPLRQLPVAALRQLGIQPRPQAARAAFQAQAQAAAMQRQNAINARAATKAQMRAQ